MNPLAVAKHFLRTVLARLPARVQEDKSLYMLGVGSAVILAILLLSIVIPYPGARLSMGLLALGVFLVLATMVSGLSVQTAVNIAISFAVVHLFYAAWQVGGIYSPRMAWLTLVPIPPFYVIGRRAGLFWMAVVLLVQSVMAYLTWANLLGESITFDQSHATFSFVVYALVCTFLMILPWLYHVLYERNLGLSQAHQQALETKQIELESAIQVREHFIGLVSHELRTPMNAILGLNGLLLGQVSDKPKAQMVLEHTQRSADHLLSVINDVLDYSQLQSGHINAWIERTDLHQTLRSAFEMVKPRVESSRIDYRMAIGPGVPEWVETDRHRLTQVLMNLLGNAIKFTQHGHIELRVDKSATGLTFAVQDTGMGIHLSQQALIFEPFHQGPAQTQSRYGGNGLGLSISRRLVSMLGGQLSVDSQEGQGSTFGFTLPLQGVAAPEPARHDSIQALQTASMPLHFLVVDDHAVNRLLLRLLLERSWPQCTVREAEDGRNAVQALQDQHHDLVFMDMVMPHMDGIEATRILRANPDPRVVRTPIIGLTANVDQQDLVRFESAGLNVLMLKPFAPEKLREQIERLLHTQAPASDTIP